MAPGGRHCPRAPPTASCQVAIPAAETQKLPEKGRKLPQMTRLRDCLVKKSFWPNLKPGNGSAGRFWPIYLVPRIVHGYRDLLPTWHEDHRTLRQAKKLFRWRRLIRRFLADGGRRVALADAWCVCYWVASRRREAAPRRRSVAAKGGEQVDHPVPPHAEAEMSLSDPQPGPP